MVPQPDQTRLSDSEFIQFRELFSSQLGIQLMDHKRTLIGTRLWKRLRACDLPTYSDYYRYITDPQHQAELATALELITTNETYFFREPRHFEFLENVVFRELSQATNLAIWSAACASGEEIYSIAMLLEQHRKGRWDLLGSDINQTMLDIAAKGIYVDQRTDKIPPHYRRQFCRRGTGPFAGTLRVNADLRSKIRLQRIELHRKLPDVGMFDVIFVRNVMIYFDDNTRHTVVNQLLEHLKPGGYLLVGHSESLRGLNSKLRQLAPAIYQAGSRQ